MVYLDDRASKGFNTVLANLVEHQFAPNPPQNFYGDLPFTGTLAGGARDFTTPNEVYWQHVDRVIDAAAARGIQVLATPAYLGFGGGNEGWYADMVSNGTTRLATYGTFIGNRYAGKANIIWNAGGDYNPPDKTLTRAVMNAIKAVDANHLQTVHCAPETEALSYWSGEAWLDIDSVYTYNPVYQISQTAYNRVSWKPFFLMESGYENESTTATQFPP